MLLESIIDSPEYEMRRRQLQLTCEHAQEWRYVFALEREERITLEVEHKAEIECSLITPNARVWASIITRQLQQLRELNHQHKLSRESIRLRQAQQRADLVV